MDPGVKLVFEQKDAKLVGNVFSRSHHMSLYTYVIPEKKKNVTLYFQKKAFSCVQSLFFSRSTATRWCVRSDHAVLHGSGKHSHRHRLSPIYFIARQLKVPLPLYPPCR